MDTPSALLVALIGAVTVGEAATADFVNVIAEEFHGDGWVEHGYEGLTTYRLYAVFDEPHAIYAVSDTPHPVHVIRSHGDTPDVAVVAPAVPHAIYAVSDVPHAAIGLPHLPSGSSSSGTSWIRPRRISSAATLM